MELRFATIIKAAVSFPVVFALSCTTIDKENIRNTTDQSNLTQKQGTSRPPLASTHLQANRPGSFTNYIESNENDTGLAVGADEDEIEINKLKAGGGIPIELNDEVNRWIQYFTERSPERFRRYLERGEKYRPMIMKVLEEQGLPPELYYLALIESGFATSATSTAKAAGIWQFIPGTGVRYGLRVDSYVDERRDPIRSTIAASLYLNDLHNVFQSWYLAMAAYNAGEGRIMRAIMTGNSRDFWTLVKNRKLPKETMNYIPKFMAAVIIGNNLEKYGFHNVKSLPDPELVAVNVPSPIRLSELAKASGVPEKVLTEYNPQIRRGVTPPGTKHYRIWVPVSYEKNIVKNNHLYAAYVLKSLKSAPQSTNQLTHKVTRGQTLSSIARSYKLTVPFLRRVNGLKSDRIIVGTVLKLSSSEDPIAVKHYKVRKGDNLHVISKKFNISIRELKRINSLSQNKIYIGQLLKVNQAG